MTESVAVAQPALSAATMEAVVIGGDLSRLAPAQRLEYYRARCHAAGLDPVARPFEYISLNGKLTLYASKSCTDQLASKHGIKLSIVSQATENGIRVVQVKAEAKDGRATEEIGAVTIANLGGDALCNAMMKAVTKAKRRAVLSLCGLGMLDETEAETIPGARTISVDAETGEIVPAGDRPSPFTAREQAEVDAFASGGSSRAPERRVVLGIPITIGKTWEQVKDVLVGQAFPKSPFAKLTFEQLIDEEKDDQRIAHLETQLLQVIQDAWGRTPPKKKAEGPPLPHQLVLIAYDKLQETRSPAPPLAAIEEESAQ